MKRALIPRFNIQMSRKHRRGSFLESALQNHLIIISYQNVNLNNHITGI